MSEPATSSGRHPWWVLGAMSLPLLALSIDINGVGTVLPSVEADLGVSPSQIGWVITASTLAFAGVLIPVGRVAPRLGVTRVLLVGVTGFGAMSLLCALAPNFGVLILGRAGQGVASALCFTTSLAVVDLVFDERRRAAAIGVWGSVSGLGGAIGPLVGGTLTTVWSWRAFFLVNIPLCLVAVPVIALLAPRDRPLPATAPVRWVRLCSLSGSLVVVIGALSYATATSWTSPVTLVALLVGAALLGEVVVDRRRTGEPTLSPGVTGSPLFRPAAVVAFCSTWGFGVTVLAMGIYLQKVVGLSALGAGLAFSTFSASFAFAGLLAGRLVHRSGILRTMAVAMAVATTAFVIQVLVAPTDALGWTVLALVVGGFGQGLAFDTSTSASLEGVPDDEAGEATGVVQTLRLLGMSVGVAVATSVASAATGPEWETEALQLVMGLCAAVAAVAVAATWRRPPVHPDRVVAAGTSGEVTP